MTQKLQPLQQSLTAVGRPSYILETSDGTRLLVLGFGARILGLFAPGLDENFYWTNPAFNEPASAKNLFNGNDRGDWPNTGGDRTWIAPELDFYYPDYPDLGRWVVPAAMDSVEHEVIQPQADRIALRRTMSLKSGSQNCHVEFEMSKWIEPAANPLRLVDRQWAVKFAGLKYAGYTQRTQLSQIGPATQLAPNSPIGGRPIEAGIWNLIQLPHGGEMIIPTYQRVEPKIYFGEIPGGRLVAEDRAVRFKMDFEGQQKIGLQAASLTGRAAYFRQHDGNHSSLVIRNFFVDPSGDYIDTPVEDTNDRGYAFQACNICNSLGQFSELEYHAPAFGHSRSDTDKTSTEVSQVWAYFGPAEAIQTVSRYLLGVGL